MVASVVAGLIAALGGDSAIAALAAQIETENNYLGQKPAGFRASEQRQFDAAIASCGPGNPDSCNRARELGGMSEQRDKELASACADGTSSLCRAAIQLATASGNVVFFDQRGAPFAVPADSPMIQVTPDPLDGTWHYTIAASVAEGLAIDSGGGALMGIGSAIRGLFRPGVAEIAVRVKGGLPPLRQECISEVKALEDIALSMRAAGASPEQVARQLHQMRRDLGVQYKDLTPAPQLEAIYARNIEKYSSQCLRRIWV